jgi:hypothetical protein
VDLIQDQRRAGSVAYSLQDCYRSSYAMFYLQDPSLLEFQRRFQDQIQSNNLSLVFGVQQIPSDSQLREVVDRHDYGPLVGVFSEYLRRMQRSKELEAYQFYDGKYLITVDGSEYFNSESVHCPLCLSRNKSSGSVEYFHQAVQPALVHPDLRQVLPLAPQFIRMQEGSDKQDSEASAGRRVIEAIRGEHPQLAVIIVADSLYSTAPCVRHLGKHRFSFLLVAKPGDHKSLFTDIEGLRRGRMLERLERKEKTARGYRRYLYEWTKGASGNKLYIHTLDGRFLDCVVPFSMELVRSHSDS